MSQDESVSPEELIERLRQRRQQREGLKPDQLHVQVAEDEPDQEVEQRSVAPHEPPPPPRREIIDQPPEQPPPPRRGPPVDERLMEAQVLPRRAPDPPPQPRRDVMAHEAPPRRGVEPPPAPRRAPPQAPPQQFADDDSDQPAERGRLISRGLLASKYGYAFGGFGLVCTANSFYTTAIAVQQIWSIMFGESDFGYIIGVIVAVTLFLGQIFNSDWDAYVPVLDEDDEVVEDEFGEPEMRLVEVPNRKRNYILWLLPDATFTAVYWMPRFGRLLSFLFLNTKVEWETVRDMWFAIPWHAAPGVEPYTWGQFALFMLLVSLPALALAAAWGFASAYYPEKALLGPRTREQIKAAVVGQFARLQGAGA